MAWFSIPAGLIISSAVMALAHLAFYLRVFGAALPLLSLGAAYALFGAAFWAGVARSLLDVEIPDPPLLSGGSREPLLGSEEPEQSIPEPPSSESQTDIMLDGSGDLSGAELRKRKRHVRGLEELTATGFGMATSFLNTSCTLAPMVLAGVESAFGYSGLEFAFVVLASFTCCASIALLNMGLGGR